MSSHNVVGRDVDGYYHGSCFCGCSVVAQIDGSPFKIDNIHKGKIFSVCPWSGKGQFHMIVISKISI